MYTVCRCHFVKMVIICSITMSCKKIFDTWVAWCDSVTSTSPVPLWRGGISELLRNGKGSMGWCFFFFSGDSLTKTHQFGVNPPAILVALICPISCWTYRSTNPEPKKTWWLARRFWKNQTFGTLKDFPKSFRFICEDKAWCCFLCRRFIFCCIFFCEDHMLFFLRASH